MNSFNITLEGKPNLAAAFQDNPALAKEVVSTFVGLMEEALSPEKGIRWADLPAEFHKELKFGDMIRGILRGSLDLKDINPEAYDALQGEIHPLSMLMPRKNWLDGGMKYTNWRAHFRLPEDSPVNEETIANLFRTMLRHIKFVKIWQLRQALEYNQIATYRGLGDVQMEKLPIFPALRYQREAFGDLHVGKFYDDIGFLDCGTISVEEHACLACQHLDLQEIAGYKVCLSCNAGFEHSAV